MNAIAIGAQAWTPAPATNANASSKRLARIGGLAYLALAALTGFAYSASASLYIAGDAAGTTARLAADPALVRAAVAADLAGGVAWVLCALILYRLLVGLGPGAAQALVVFTSLGAGIMMLNCVLQLAALRVATGAIDLPALGAAGTSGAAQLLMDTHAYGTIVASVFMGLWLIPFGMLVRRSGGLLPGPVGSLLIIGGACYLAKVLAAILAPELHEAIKGVILMVPTVPEVVMVGFLLVVGVRSPRPEGLQAVPREG